jgi:Tfp pilus assembly protein PilF
MGIDYRPDHSFRIPRPDLSIKIGSPDACIRCHQSKTSQWANETLTKWYGPGRRGHYGLTLAAGRSRRPETQAELIRLASDPLYPVIVRATALSILRDYPSLDSLSAMENALMDDEALIRRTAAEHIGLSDSKADIRRLAPLLYDPVKAVRIEAARRLAPKPFKQQLSNQQQQKLKTALAEFESAMAYSADFAFGRFNLGNLYAALSRPEQAEENFRAAIDIDDLFYPAKVNLAMLYNQRGQNDLAERLLRQVVEHHPELPEIAYSLGLLLAEMQAYHQAVVYLEKAAAGLPDRARVYYNLGLLRQHLGEDDQAEAALSKALTLAPDNMDYLHALADHYLKRQKLIQARRLAEQMIINDPDRRIGHELLEIIRKSMEP